MIYQLKSYLIFLLHATNQHGVHSPFVFDFVTKCLYDTTNYPAYKTLYAYRAALLDSKETIKVADFGAGSRVFTSDVRQVSAIAKHAGATRKRMNLLYRLARYFEPSAILELGTSVGLGTAALALANTGMVTTLEGCQETARVARNQLDIFGLTETKIGIGSFEKSFGQLNAKSFDLIYFDGNHSKKATLSYFEVLLPTTNNNSIWIFDDIHWSVEMTAAWQEIKKHPQVRVTVDCFWLGFVFFRKEQREQHFKIRL